MIPILYNKDETSFTSNGIGRLRDCISCVVTEERNGIYECDFEYPITGANYELIQIGRIIGVTHDETSDIQPFDIVGFSKPIDGIVTFHAVHISYRQTRLTVTGTNINSLADAFTLLGTAKPSNPFTYWTDKGSTGFLAAANGVPHSVREMLGGMEGSILDIYGGEYEWDKWTVKLWGTRGTLRDFSIRYGVNMLEYEDELDAQSCYSSCVPFWTNGETTIVGDVVSNGVTPTGRGECVPLDVSTHFDEQPTKAQVEAEGLSYMQTNNTNNPSQNIKVSFVRLQDMGEFAQYQSLLQCKMCDTIKVIFPDYNTSGQFKIVKTVWNVLTGKYDEMELGELSVTLAQALGVSSSSSYVGSGGGGGGGTDDYADLNNKPKINNVTLSGNKSLSDLGINIPTVNDATLTIQKNGADVQTFTANASSDKTANITVHDVPSGGSSGQVLSKASGTDYDLEWVNQSGGGSGTDVPTANEVAEFDDDAHMNSTDMTSQEVEDFVDGLDISGGANGFYSFIKSVTFNSSGVATITEQGVTPATRILVTRCFGSAGSLIFNAKATSNNTITVTAWNSGNAGSAWAGTTDLTFLIDNR